VEAVRKEEVKLRG